MASGQPLMLWYREPPEASAEWALRRGNPVLLVTHEPRYADLCGRKIEISDGRI